MKTSVKKISKGVFYMKIPQDLIEDEKNYINRFNYLIRFAKLKSNLIEKIEARFIRITKNFMHAFGRKIEKTIPVFIMGYGRSGSSMLFKIFERDLRIRAFGENHPAVAKNYLLRYDLLQKIINNSKFEAVVFKPILNSFDISKLLSIYPHGVYIWLVRDFQDVVASAIKRFGPNVANYLKNYIEHGKGDNWISKGLPDATKNKIQNFTKNLTLNTEDWMALVWWAVNHTIIKEELYNVNSLYIIRYEDLVSNPEPILNEIYKTIGISYQKSLGKYIHKKSVGKGAGLKINKNIYQICLDLDNQIFNLTESKKTE